MGLLDFLNSDESRLGIGLLAAAGPRSTGTGFGQRLSDAMGYVSEGKQADMRSKLLQSQLDENVSQSKLRDQQMAMAVQKQNMLQGMFGGVGGGSPISGSSTGGGVNMSAGQPGMGNLANMSLDQITALKANGIDLLEPWKIAQQGLKQDAGSYYKMPNGQTQYMPQLDKGMGVINGQVAEAPGYSQANANIQGAQAGAIARAQLPYSVAQDAAKQNLGAQLDPTKVFNPATRREEFVPRAVVAGGAPRQSPQYSGAGYAGGSANAAAQGQLEVMQSELARLPANHPDRPAIMREMQRLGGQPQAQAQMQPQSGNYAAGPSAQESLSNEVARVQAVDQAKADVLPTSTKMAAVDSARDAVNTIDKALAHPGLKTATGLQGTLDPRNYIPGTDATNFRALMDQIKGGVFLDAFQSLKGGGAITELEGAKAEAAKARINSAQSPDEFVKGLNDYKAIVQRGLSRAEARVEGNQPSQGGASGSWGGAPVPKVPMRGQVIGGYKFKGGNPSDKSNWEQAQ